ncbi:MAG: carbohydrate kinase family protein [Wenzhouxiangellaceae bacterium]|nr:carbohydrate kinase family protein [Wenzhouxiangellaceae bacterium]
MSILICGSLAYDTIMVFPERFKDHIIPEKTHMLNVAFLVPEMRRNFGGCAGNIAYSLNKLGGQALPMAAVGADFDRYSERLDKLGISQQFVLRDDQYFTAQAYITTDLDDNQITAFHPGAMNENHRNDVPVDGSITYGIVAPDGKQAMLSHADQFKAAGIPHVFDPGQGLPMFSGDELKGLIADADWLTVNSYEWEMIVNKTGWSRGEVLSGLKGGLIVTHGGEGSQMLTHGGECHIPAVKPERIADPTGCGDAYRAGLLFGLERSWDPADAARLGSLLGSIKIAHSAPQGFEFEPDQIRQRFAVEFGHTMPA